MKTSVSMSEVFSCDLFSSILVSSFAEMINNEEIRTGLERIQLKITQNRIGILAIQA
jgi:hypothetical protein